MMALGPRQVAPELLNKVTKALGITALDQWYYVSQHVASQAIGARALNDFGGSVPSFLKHAYPLHQFDEEKLAPRRNMERDQKFIEVIIRKLFPNTEIHTKAKKAVGIINPETDAYLEIDFWIPSLKLGIEYQDKHHYEYQWYANGALEDYQKRDSIKKDAMATLGYTLITIGYWWDRSLESIVATIRKFRPDLLQQYESVSSEPIPHDPPSEYITEAPMIPGIAGLMSPFVPRQKFNPTNWFAGEKHDGIRGVYNPELNKMYSRSGKELSILPSLLQDIPDMLADGEITAGRGNYNKTAAMSYHSQHEKVNWPMFRYIMFDIPDAELGNYTQRYSVITSALFVRPYVFAQSAFRVLINDKPHLKALVDAIISNAGEGVIVQTNTQYEYGRAKGLAKIKVRRDDDAKVLYVDSNSCTCKLVNGVVVDIEFFDDFDPSQLRVGDIISYYHNGYAENGRPKQAEIYKVRYDLTWDKLISDADQNVVKQRSVEEATGGRSLLARGTARNKMGHWTKQHNCRAYLDSFAAKAGFDPLVADNWYTVRCGTLRKAGGGGMLNAHGYYLKKLLSLAYPELKFEQEKFMTSTKGHWNKPPNVRAFFDDFARSSGFDPLVAENWYSVRGITLQNAGGGGLLYTYNYSLKKALKCAYPKLKFETERFVTWTMKARNKMRYWNKPPNVRAFLDEFARTNEFDPLVPENWYPVTIETLQNAGGSGLLDAQGYSIKKALTTAYPELNFESEKFKTTDKARNRMGHWFNPSNVREFFDDFARTAGFDPRLAENWYSVRYLSLQNTGGGGLLNTYDHSIMKSLSRAYPELRFDESKFITWKPKGYWTEATNVREFLDEFARTTGFDPLVPENWYPVRIVTLRNAGAGGLLNAYTYDLKKLLMFGYPELKFEEEKFINWKTKGYWNKLANVRAFFDEFARTNKIDPLVPENWYQVRGGTMRNAGGGGLLNAYDYSLPKALASAYPELKFEEDKFITHDKTKGKT